MIKNYTTLLLYFSPLWIFFSNKVLSFEVIVQDENVYKAQGHEHIPLPTTWVSYPDV